MHARADVCFPLNVSWAAATASGAVMYFQIEGLVQQPPNNQKKGIFSVRDVVFFYGKLRGTIGS